MDTRGGPNIYPQMRIEEEGEGGRQEVVIFNGREVEEGDGGEEEGIFISIRYTFDTIMLYNTY